MALSKNEINRLETEDNPLFKEIKNAQKGKQIKLWKKKKSDSRRKGQ